VTSNVASMSEPSRTVLTREAVVAAAQSMIERDGLDALSLRRLASDLGVTAPALYAYVTDKRDLLAAVAESAFERLTGGFDAVTAADPLDRVRAASRVYIDFAVENPQLFQTMFVFPPDLGFSEPTGEELPAATKAFSGPLTNIEAAVASGQLRGDPIDIALVLWTAIHGAAEVLLMGFAFDDDGREHYIDSVLDTILAGLTPSTPTPSQTGH